MEPLIIYHKNCRDGFTAAWVARKRFPNAEFVPAQYGDAPPDVKGRDVYVLDFSYPRAVLEKMHEEATFLLVLDHHKTAEEDLRGLPYAVFDMERSGAGLAWDYIFPRDDRPWLVNYVEDRDLWRFALPDSKAVNAGISVVPMTFEEWDFLHRVGLQHAFNQGKAILRHQDMLIGEITRNAATIEHAGRTAAYVNCPLLLSEALGELAKTHDFAVGWFEQADGGRIFSLRSHNPTGLDVGAIAKRFGGGGHKHAAGFRRADKEIVAELVKDMMEVAA